MPYNPKIHNKKSIRLKGYDYTKEGLYFITICVQNRECQFGHFENSKMTLNQLGTIADNYWSEISNHYPQIKLHEHIVMPNHLHNETYQRQFSKPISGSVSMIINQYKSSVKRWCNKNGHENFQ